MAQGVGGLGGGGRLATHVGPPLRPFPPAVRRLWTISRSHPGTPGVRGPSTGNMGAVYPLIPAYSRPKSACSARVHGSQGSSGWPLTRDERLAFKSGKAASWVNGWSSALRWTCSRKSGSTSWVIPGAESDSGLDRSVREGGEDRGGGACQWHARALTPVLRRPRGADATPR